MRLSFAFVIPRYVRSMGGAEALCAALGRALVADGCQVTILTTCAADNRTWNNEMPAGPFFEDGLNGIRFPVDERDLDKWIPLQIRLSEGHPLTIDEQLDWLAHSVNSRGLIAYLNELGRGFDAIFFAPYLFGTTFWGSQVIPDRSIIIPCLHDEPAGYLPVFGAMLRGARGVIFNAHAEGELAQRLHGALPSGVVGMGFEPISEELETKLEPPNMAGLRPNDKYLLYLGRKETGKNVHLLIDLFCGWKSSSAVAGETKLVICGGGSFSDLHRPHVLERDDVVDIAHVSECDKMRLLKYARALVQPSTNESFSIVMMEGWRLGVPSVVHGLCPVTRDHVLRSGGGLYFSTADDFFAVIDRLITDEPLSRALGDSGRAYVDSEYSWGAVIRRFYDTVELLFGREATLREGR